MSYPRYYNPYDDTKSKNSRHTNGMKLSNKKEEDNNIVKALDQYYNDVKGFDPNESVNKEETLLRILNDMKNANQLYNGFKILDINRLTKTIRLKRDGELTQVVAFSKILPQFEMHLNIQKNAIPIDGQVVEYEWLIQLIKHDIAAGKLIAGKLIESIDDIHPERNVVVVTDMYGTKQEVRFDGLLLDYTTQRKLGGQFESKGTKQEAEVQTQNLSDMIADGFAKALGRVPKTSYIEKNVVDRQVSVLRPFQQCRDVSKIWNTNEISMVRKDGKLVNSKKEVSGMQQPNIFNPSLPVLKRNTRTKVNGQDDLYNASSISIY